jgi:hypothetical protein
MLKYKIDLTGQVFGRLRVLHCSRKQGRVYFWECLCECGNITEGRVSNLRSGQKLSCGCLHKEVTSNKFRTHGRSNTREFRIWAGMLTRCTNKNHHKYHRYGGRGINVCARWQESFENFFSDMGICPAGHSLDRINNDGNYEPVNCRWATNKQQSWNSSTPNFLSFDGQSLPASEWAVNLGIPQTTFHRHLNKGMSIDEIVRHFYGVTEQELKELS